MVPTLVLYVAICQVIQNMIHFPKFRMLGENTHSDTIVIENNEMVITLRNSFTLEFSTA